MWCSGANCPSRAGAALRPATMSTVCQPTCSMVRHPWPSPYSSKTILATQTFTSTPNPALSALIAPMCPGASGPAATGRLPLHPAGAARQSAGQSAVVRPQARAAGAHCGRSAAPAGLYHQICSIMNDIGGSRCEQQVPGRLGSPLVRRSAAPRLLVQGRWLIPKSWGTRSSTRYAGGAPAPWV